MNQEARKRFLVQLERHEGCVLKPYKDTVGKLTIGIGRNLDDVGISRDEAYYLASNDIDSAEKTCMKNITGYLRLSENRQLVLLNMCYNLGIGRLLGFKNTLAAIAAGNYDLAAAGMLASKWAEQVGDRAKELAEIMRTNKWPDT